MRWPYQSPGRCLLRLGCALAAVAAASLALGAELRIATQHASRVFRPGESFSLEVTADPAGVEPGTAYLFAAELIDGPSGRAVWRGDTLRVDAPVDGPAPIPLTIPLPADEGDYRVVLRVTRPPGFAARFRVGGGAKVLAERSFDVSVFDPRTPATRPGEWREEYAFDPASPTWRDRLPDWTGWRRLPWVDAGPVGSATGRGAPASLGGYVEIPASGERDAAHWQAFPLATRADGEPFLVEVEYPTDAPQQLGVAVLDADADGRLGWLGASVVAETPRWGGGAAAVARMVCWPRTDGPVLLLHNPDETRPARFGRVRVLRAERVAAPARPAAQRRVMLDFSDQAAARLVGLDPASPGAVAAARRLADRVEIAGARGTVMTIRPNDEASDLPPDPLLEMALREFGRRGLRLTPAPPLSTEGSALDEETRRALVDRVAATHRRCAPHQGYDSIALRVGPGSPLLLVEGRDGYDAKSVDRFLAEQQRRWPPGVDRDPAAHAAAIRQAGLDEAFVAWRREQLGEFYTAVKRIVGREPLVLGDGLHRVAEIARATRPSLSGQPDTPDALLRIGLAPDGVPIAAPWSIALDRPLARRSAAPAAAAGLRSVIGGASGPRAARLHAVRWDVELIEADRWLRLGEDRIVSCVAAPFGGVAEALAAAVVDGAETIVDSGPAASGGADPVANALRRLAAQLPGDSVDSSTESAGVGVHVLRARHGRDTLIAAVNASPWRRRGAVELRAEERCLVTSLDRDEAAGAWREGPHAADFDLGPGETRAWRYMTDAVLVESVTVESEEAAGAELAAALDELNRRDRTVRRRVAAIANPSFETIDAAEGATSWTAPSGEPAATVGEASEGQRSLALGGDSAADAARCALFPLPETGQLAISLKARAEGAASNAELRIDLSQPDGAYRVHTVVPAERLRPGEADGAGWRDLVFAVDDLPLGDGPPLRLTLSVVGEGRVLVDDLRAESLKLPLPAYADDLRPTNLALARRFADARAALEEGRLEECRRLLDAYPARFLNAYFPLQPERAPIATADEPDTDDAADGESEDDESPSVAERLRGYLPSFWR